MSENLIQLFQRNKLTGRIVTFYQQAKPNYFETDIPFDCLVRWATSDREFKPEFYGQFAISTDEQWSTTDGCTFPMIRFDWKLEAVSTNGATRSISAERLESVVRIKLSVSLIHTVSFTDVDGYYLSPSKYNEYWNGWVEAITDNGLLIGVHPMFYEIDGSDGIAQQLKVATDRTENPVFTIAWSCGRCDGADPQWNPYISCASGSIAIVFRRISWNES